MESNMVNFVSDNTSMLENNIAIKLINDFFKNNLNQFKLIEFFDSENQYNGFYIRYGRENIQITLRNSWQGLDCEIFIENNLFLLSHF